MAPHPGRSRPWYALGALVLAVAGAGGWVAGRAAGTSDGVPGESSVDVGFLRDMAAHHDQAVQLALIQLASGGDEVLEGFAVDTIASQRYEIGLMEARLQDWGVGRGAVGRDAMAWTGDPTPPAEMPGMASQAEVTHFASALGADADRLFIRLMTAHHEGGIHMATHAMEHAENARVRQLAERIAKGQRLEIRDLALAQARLDGRDERSG